VLTDVDEFPITIPVPLSIQRNWGAYRPWFSVAKYTSPPEQCSITQVNIVRVIIIFHRLWLRFALQLQRHGARYPTRGAQAGMLAALDKLKSAHAYLHPHLIFLKSYEYDLQTNNLVYFGAQQCVSLPFGIVHTSPIVEPNSPEKKLFCGILTS